MNEVGVYLQESEEFGNRIFDRFNVLSEEREQGTLALTLSQPVSARDVVGAKLASRALLVMGLAAGVSLLGILATGEASDRPAACSSGARRWSCTRCSGSRSRRG